MPNHPLHNIKRGRGTQARVEEPQITIAIFDGIDEYDDDLGLAPPAPPPGFVRCPQRAENDERFG
jgi:hypothetical protein